MKILELFLTFLKFHQCDKEFTKAFSEQLRRLSTTKSLVFL